jgi:hypothetical protein
MGYAPGSEAKPRVTAEKTGARSHTGDRACAKTGETVATRPERKG